MRSPAQDAFDALSDPTRRAILDFLARSGEVTAGAIADAVDEVGRTAVSSHLRVLRTCGLVDERRQGRYRYYELAADGPVFIAFSFYIHSWKVDQNVHKQSRIQARVVQQSQSPSRLQNSLS